MEVCTAIAKIITEIRGDREIEDEDRGLRGRERRGMKEGRRKDILSLCVSSLFLACSSLLSLLNLFSVFFALFSSLAKKKRTNPTLRAATTSPWASLTNRTVSGLAFSAAALPTRVDKKIADVQRQEEGERKKERGKIDSLCVCEGNFERED